MLQVLSLMSKCLFAPIWLLWKGYGVLWWAFEGTGRAAQSPGPRTPERGNAFEVTDTRDSLAHLPPPTGLLRGGFVGTLFSSGFILIFAQALQEAGVLSADRSWALWGCGTAFAAVGSIFAVRHVALRQAKRKSLAQRVKASVLAGARRAANAGATVGDQLKAAANQAGRVAAASVAGTMGAGRAVPPSPAASHADANSAVIPPHTVTLPASDPRGVLASGRFCATRLGHACAKAGLGCGRVAARAARAAVAGACHAAHSFKQGQGQGPQVQG